jgi:hypothetical protein
MDSTKGRWRPTWSSAEFLLLMVAAWLAFISVPLALGRIGISWDALNHHIYLGWVADSPRFDRDYLAASYQAYQFPYLYWPVYKLATGGFSGAWAGVVLASLYWLAVPAMWMIARTCMPGAGLFDMAMRVLAVALSFCSGLILSLFDSTPNDLLAAIPLVWAIALGLAAVPTAGSTSSARIVVLWSGFLAGVSIACKFSNGPLAVLLPVLWVFSGVTWKERLLNVLAGNCLILIGFLAT